MGDRPLINQNAINGIEIKEQDEKHISDPINTKPIVYISSYLLGNSNDTSSFDFFVQIVTNLSNELHKNHYDLIVKIPTDLNPTQSDILDRIFINNELYYAIIIAPTKTNDLFLKLKKLLQDSNILDNCPIITIDKYLDKKINGISIPYITSNWERGGEYAAEILTDHFTKSTNECLLLILKGTEGSKPRIDGFLKKLKQINTFFGKNKCSYEKSTCISTCKGHCKFKVIISEELDFSREASRDHILKYFHESYSNISGIFSCNDEMALGSREALIKLKDNDVDLKEIKIVGFDGINEVRKYLDDKNERFLIGTIDVKIKEQVIKVIEYLSSPDKKSFKKKIIDCNKITKSS